MVRGVRNILELSSDLAALAAREGEPHLIDTPAEKENVTQIIEEAIEIRKGANAELAA